MEGGGSTVAGSTDAAQRGENEAAEVDNCEDDARDGDADGVAETGFTTSVGEDEVGDGDAGGGKMKAPSMNVQPVSSRSFAARLSASLPAAAEIEGGGSTMADEGGKATRCAQDDGGVVVETAMAGCETVGEVAGCTIGVVTEEVGAGEGMTVRGGAAVRTIRGVAGFLERELILFLAALRGAADDLALASLAAVQQTWHLLRAGKPLVLMNRSW